MNRKIYFSLLGLIFIVTSCFNTHDNYYYKKQMMGRWQIKSITITSYVHNNVLSTQNRGNFTASDYLQFNQDGTGYLSLNFAPTNSAFGSMNYTTGGSDQNNVTAINSKGTFAFKILSVDESSMHIIYTQNDRSASIGDRTYEEYQVNVARN